MPPPKYWNPATKTSEYKMLYESRDVHIDAHISNIKIPPFETVVLGSSHRESIINMHLDYAKIPFSVYPCDDYEMPKDFEPLKSYKYIPVKSQLGAYRCFKGHQYMLANTKSDRVLVFEDDAYPNTMYWKERVMSGMKLSIEKDIGVVSLHARILEVYKNPTFVYDNLHWFEPMHDKLGFGTVRGSCAYIISRETISQWLKMNYEGCPVDIFLATYFKMICINKTPFNHDVKQRSLVENPFP